VKGQLLEEQIAQEMKALYWLAQAYAPYDGTPITDSTADHTTYV